MKILVVEDEILIQKSIIMLLKKRGVDADGSSSGKEAIDLIINNNFDRILCDLMLKDITGFEIIEESKKKYTTKEIQNKFIIMTAYSSDNILEQASRYGCYIIKKPFNNINQVINYLINGKNNE
ncbi:MAG: response regulator [Bdellovibrionales bacterium]|jgi:CheY-like chemotaxis protein|nr:response regulator [Bdellovibrionales bacterium]